MKLYQLGACDFARKNGVEKMAKGPLWITEVQAFISASHSTNHFCSLYSSMQYQLEIWSIVPRDEAKKEKERERKRREKKKRKRERTGKGLAAQKLQCAWSWSQHN